MEQNYEKIKSDFMNRYDSDIVPILEQKEKEKSAHIFLAMLTGFFFLTIGILLFKYFVTSNISKDEEFFVLFFSGIFLYLGYIIPKNIFKKFEIETKKKIMPILCSCFKNITWSNDKEINDDFVKNSNIFDIYDRISFDDIFYGTHNNSTFGIYEAKMTYTVRAGKHSYTLTVFKGIIINIKLNKQYKSNTIVRPRIKIRQTPYKPKISLKETELEDVCFNNKYDVFTNDEIEARILITPSFIEKLNNLKENFNFKNFYCGVNVSEVTLGLQNGSDCFKIGSIFRTLHNKDCYSRLIDEVIEIYKLIDYLNFDNSRN